MFLRDRVRVFLSMLLQLIVMPQDDHIVILWTSAHIVILWTFVHPSYVFMTHGASCQ